jgi:hypothetical protein
MEWPPASVAEPMGRSKGANAQPVFRGLDKLRELLEEPEED